MVDFQNNHDAVICDQSGRRIQVLLADDHKILRQGLGNLLKFEPDVEVVGEAENGLQAVEIARLCCPEIVIMDINMPVMNGIDATRILAEEMPQVKVIALSMHMELEALSRMHEAGAVAYLAKGSSAEELMEAIRVCYVRPPKNRRQVRSAGLCCTYL